MTRKELSARWLKKERGLRWEAAGHYIDGSPAAMEKRKRVLAAADAIKRIRRQGDVK